MPSQSSSSFLKAEFGVRGERRPLQLARKSLLAAAKPQGSRFCGTSRPLSPRTACYTEAAPAKIEVIRTENPATSFGALR